MKIKSFLTIIVSLLFIASCEMTELEGKQVNPNNASEDNLDVDFLFNAIQLNFEDFLITASRPGMQTTRMIPMTGGINYQSAWTANTFSWMWNRAYHGVMVNIDALIPVAEEKGLPNYVGAVKVIKAYILMVLVDYFGDVPLTEALQGTSAVSPVADPQNSVYDAALALLDEAVASFDEGSGVVPNTDMFYGGDAAAWRAAAQTLKMRYYLTTRLVNGSSNSGFASVLAAGDYIQSGQDFGFYYGASRAVPNARHPWYNNQYEVGGGTYHSNYYIWHMRDESKPLEDPRLRYYFYRQDWDFTDDSKWNQFTLDFVDFSDPANPGILNRPTHYPAGMPFGMATNSNLLVDSDGYYGRDHGNADGIPPDGLLRVVYGVYPAGGKYDAADPTDPSTFGHVGNAGTDGATGQGVFPVMMASYVSFMRAEAALTMGTGENAAALLEEGVRESMSFVSSFATARGQGPGIDAASIDAYATVVTNEYAGAANDAERLDIVMREYWLALWGNGMEAYNNYRRTGYPSNMQPTREAGPGNFPRSMFYPASYVNLNANADQKATDDLIFWDNGSSTVE